MNPEAQQIQQQIQQLQQRLQELQSQDSQQAQQGQQQGQEAAAAGIAQQQTSLPYRGGGMFGGMKMAFQNMRNTTANALGAAQPSPPNQIEAVQQQQMATPDNMNQAARQDQAQQQAQAAPETPAAPPPAPTAPEPAPAPSPAPTPPTPPPAASHHGMFGMGNVINRAISNGAPGTNPVPQAPMPPAAPHFGGMFGKLFNHTAMASPAAPAPAPAPAHGGGGGLSGMFNRAGSLQRALGAHMPMPTTASRIARPMPASHGPVGMAANALGGAAHAAGNALKKNALTRAVGRFF